MESAKLVTELVRTSTWKSLSLELPMDLERIINLQKLAGLKLGEDELQQIKLDLEAMEFAAARLSVLPEKDLAEGDPASDGQPPGEIGPAADDPAIHPCERPDMNREQVMANAPDYSAGLFQIPAVDTTSCEETS